MQQQVKRQGRQAAQLGGSTATPWAVRWAIPIGVLLLWLVLAHDGRHHWDEPLYLHTAAFFDTSQILDPSIQPAHAFYSSKVLHLLWARTIFSLTGPGRFGIALVAASYTILLLATLALSVAIVRKLIGWRHEMWLGAAFAAMTPIVLWLGFKTLPETPALFAVVLAIWAYLQGLERDRFGSALPWLLLAGVALAVTALTRNALALSFATFVVTLLVFRGWRFPVVRIVAWGAAAGAISLAVFAALLRLTAIGLEEYLWVLSNAMGERSPIVVRLYAGVMELGPLWLAAPLALLHRPRREALFFLVWLALATGAVFALLSDIESRYLILNLPPLVALVCLATAGVVERVHAGRRRLLAVVVLVLLAAIGAMAQPFMEHEVMSGDVDRVIRALDARYGGPQRYTILTAWHHTDFHYLRVAYPDHLVRSVQREGVAANEPPSEVDRRHYGDELLLDYEALSPQRRPWLYYGFEANFSLANIRKLAGWLPSEALRERVAGVIEKMTKYSQFTRSWMWSDRRFRFSSVLRQGYYRVDEVTPVDGAP